MVKSALSGGQLDMQFGKQENVKDSSLLLAGRAGEGQGQGGHLGWARAGQLGFGHGCC